jgi:hypothetical protein
MAPRKIDHRADAHGDELVAKLRAAVKAVDEVIAKLGSRPAAPKRRRALPSTRAAR